MFGRGRRARSCFATPLAVPEKIFGLPLFLDFFDRCANPRSCLLFSRKRLVATESCREGVYNRAGERSVTFCKEETLRNE